jgi:hypothetical protein
MHSDKRLKQQFDPQSLDYLGRLDAIHWVKFSDFLQIMLYAMGMCGLLWPFGEQNREIKRD